MGSVQAVNANPHEMRIPFICHLRMKNAVRRIPGTLGAGLRHAVRIALVIRPFSPDSVVQRATTNVHCEAGRRRRLTGAIPACILVANHGSLGVLALPPATTPFPLGQYAGPDADVDCVRLFPGRQFSTRKRKAGTMKDMGSWEADEPGDYGPWWVSRKKYFPAAVSAQFKDFVSALNQHNSSKTPGSLAELSAAAKQLIKALDANRIDPRFSIRDRLALVAAPKMKSSTAPKSPTDNLITAVTNVIKGFGGQIVPDRYEV
jgi:hypothetical protein